MLDRASDDVPLVGIQCQCGLDRGVDGFRPTAGKKQFVHMASGQSSHASPGLIEGLRCLPPKGIGAGGIPVAAPQPGHHRLKNLRVDLRGGIVIEINHRTHGGSL